MINGFFDKLSEDISWMNKTHPKHKSAILDEITIKVGAARFRMTGRLIVAGAAALTFIALPLLSCGIGVIFLAGAVLLYIAGHDLFKIAENKENPSVRTFGKALWSGIIHGEEAAQESVDRDCTNHTILQSFWMEIFKNQRNSR